MGRLRLGQFLIEKNLATPCDVVRALELQARRRTPLGEVCIQEGVLLVADVLEILNQQLETPHELFAEIAVAKGLLTQEQCEVARRLQKIFSEPLGQILVEIGVVEQADMDEALEEFDELTRSRLGR